MAQSREISNANNSRHVLRNSTCTRQLFNISLKFKISRKTRVIATHQLQILEATDWIIVLARGQIEMQETYTDLLTGNLNFLNILGLDKQEEDLNEKLQDIKKLTTSEIDVDDCMDAPEVELEKQESGSTKAIIYWRYFRAGTNSYRLGMMLILLIIAQIVAGGTDYWVIFWTHQETLRNTYNVSTQYVEPPAFETSSCIYIYTVLMATFLLFTPLKNVLFYKICSKSSASLHNGMLSSVLSAPMKFFDLNPTGRILNRFTKDLGVADETLSKSFSETLMNALLILGHFILMIIINNVLLVPIIIVSGLYFVCVRFYMRAAVDLRRTEAIARSPIYSHVTSSLNGLATIRTCRMSPDLIKELDTIIDVHTSCWHLTIATQTLLGIVLDIFAILLVTSMIFIYILMEYLGVEAIVSGNVGFTISTALTFTGLIQYTVRQVTEIINNMTSVERLLEYTNLEQEPSPSTIPSPAWPTTGKIEFKSLNLLYNPADGPILKDLSFVIESGWKVGVVGRSGAGKSSLISAIFRLYPIAGRIIIDSLDTGEVCLQSLRSKISIIPQNPVLFSTTLRHNLDPFEQFDDFTLWKVLEDVELRNVVDNLDFKVIAGGNNFSVGQRQLICLARAILRDNKILLLDEATANVDPKTDALIQRTIRSKFKNFTVVTIAHRLNTVMDSDRILVLDAGRIREYGIPYELLQDPNGALTNMTKGVHKGLYKIAEQTYQSMTLKRSDKDTVSGRDEIQSVADYLGSNISGEGGVVNKAYQEHEEIKI